MGLAISVRPFGALLPCHGNAHGPQVAHREPNDLIRRCSDKLFRDAPRHPELFAKARHGPRRRFGFLGYPALLVGDGMNPNTACIIDEFLMTGRENQKTSGVARGSAADCRQNRMTANDSGETNTTKEISAGRIQLHAAY
ncbi:hypothetical protein [Methyloferula stellata]|uniref:hypothetical protein n=1 Tax=Methyloferula stellata TaxID=876270 RepID=UPI0012687008|nr:hypothetical protein [Methyloferula stellata]